MKNKPLPEQKPPCNDIEKIAEKQAETFRDIEQITEKQTETFRDIERIQEANQIPEVKEVKDNGIN